MNFPEVRAIMKETDAFLASLESPLRDLGYRLERLTATRHKCPECPRTFVHAMHLGRHRRATHRRTGREIIA
jgi:hypothetical protein